MALCYKDRTWCTSICATQPCDRRLTREVREAARKWGETLGLDYGPVSHAHLNCADFTPDTSPAGKLRKAVWDSMEEAEMFREMSAPERAVSLAWLDSFPPEIVAAIGRSFINATKEAAR